MTTAVEVRGLGKRFRLYRDKNQTLKTAILRGGRASYDELWAVRDATFDVPQGTTFGLVGSNGSGKSTLLRCLARILRADEGTQRVHGRVAALLELGSGFHHELTGRQNVYLNGTILGMKQRELHRRMDDIVAFAGLEAAIDQPVKNYSSGMYARLGFAVATSIDPEVLLVDEVLAVGDVSFQRRCMDRIRELRGAGRTVIIVSHDDTALRALCDQAAWLKDGRVESVGQVDLVLDGYLRSMAEQRQEVAGDQTRWGNGNVVITDVELLDAHGSITHVVNSGEPIDVRIGWSRRNDVSELAIGLGIWADDGTHMWGANTGGAALTLDTQAAEGTVSVRIPRLALQAGGFSVDVAAHDSTGAHTYDYRRRVVRFDVLKGGGRESGGYVALSPEWRV